ncbi:I196L [African swine fever virus]|uniref:I196L CDS protein n=1 Tax=African swine fever virus TaxID=10497 RepID=A0A6V6ZEG2_ASF|nr:I196L [African swine fever virus]WEG42027.1 I196L [African swine fever virus]WEG42487.1 I196L [African swine fever virus]WEG42666.1 I196L [African swine fever virus]CAD0059594.1 I196L CDS [African swine fever virus]
MLFRYLVWLFRFIEVKNVVSISLLVIGSNYLTTAISNNTSTTISPTTTSSNYLMTAIPNIISDKEDDIHFSTDKTVFDRLSPITLYRAIRSTLNDTSTKTMTDHILTRPYRPTTVIFHSDTPQPVKNATQGNIVKKYIDKCLPFLFNLIPFFPVLKIMKFF